MLKKVKSYLFFAITNCDSHLESCVNQEILISSIKLTQYYSIQLGLGFRV